jgi:hypothetical protein
VADFRSLSPDEQLAVSERARTERRPLIERWSTLGDVTPPEWERRAALAARLLRDVPAVVDLGCGTMVLERYLAAEQRYIPVDVVAQDARTIVLDLDHDELPAFDADTCTLLGVLGYLYDPAAALRKTAQRFTRGLLSYESVELNAKAIARGRRNGLALRDLRTMIEDAGWRIAGEARLTSGEQLFDLVRAEPIVG